MVPAVAGEMPGHRVGLPNVKDGNVPAAMGNLHARLRASSEWALWDLLPLLPTTVLQPCGGLSWDCKCAKAAVAIWTVYLVWSNYAKKVIIILCSLD